MIACLAVVALCGCSQISAPTYDLQSVGCRSASDAMLATASSKLTVDGALRNGKIVDGGAGRQFMSAELHRRDDDKHDKGDLLTFAVIDGNESEFLAVDIHAREDSSWPAAQFGVQEHGARESRACADIVRGKTKAQIECESGSAGQAPVPGNRDCGSL